MVLQWKKVKFNKKWNLMMQEEDKAVRLQKLISEVAAEHDARHARNWSNAIAHGRIMFQVSPVLMDGRFTLCQHLLIAPAVSKGTFRRVVYVESTPSIWVAIVIVKMTKPKQKNRQDSPGRELPGLWGLYVKDLIGRLICEGSACEVHMLRIRH